MLTKRDVLLKYMETKQCPEVNGLPKGFMYRVFRHPEFATNSVLYFISQDGNLRKGKSLNEHSKFDIDLCAVISFINSKHDRIQMSLSDLIESSRNRIMRITNAPRQRMIVKRIA